MICKFAFQKYGHGIFVIIDADEIIMPEVYNTDLLVSKNIYLRMIEELPVISKVEAKQYFIKAIKDVESEIYSKIKDLTICIQVNKIVTNPDSFHEETLYCVLRDWLSQKYDLNLPPIDVDYDLNTKRFIFNYKWLGAKKNNGE